VLEENYYETCTKTYYYNDCNNFIHYIAGFMLQLTLLPGFVQKIIIPIKAAFSVQVKVNRHVWGRAREFNMAEKV
jgi:hypothetical protein